jgi:hypothetical protein
MNAPKNRGPVVVVDYADPFDARPRMTSAAAAAARHGDARASGGGGPARAAPRSKDDDLRARRAVAELGASGFSQSAKRARGDSALAAIGAVVKQQRMPFRMALGVAAKRAKRAAAAEAEARASGVVRAGGAGANKRAKRAAKAKNREREAPDEPTPYDQRGAVLHVRR